MDVKEILDELADSVRGMEMDYFFRCVKKNDLPNARKILMSHLNSDKSDFLLAYYVKRQKTQYDLIEVSLEEIINDDTYYLFRIGMNIEKSSILDTQRGKEVFSGGAWYSIEHVQQVWKIVERL